MSLIHFRPFEHTSQELRELADEIWDKGFKSISTVIHEMARIQENHERIAKRINDSKQTKA